MFLVFVFGEMFSFLYRILCSQFFFVIGEIIVKKNSGEMIPPMTARLCPSNFFEEKATFRLKMSFLYPVIFSAIPYGK